MLKVEAVRVRFLSYSEEEVRQRPFSLPPGERRDIFVRELLSALA